MKNSIKLAFLAFALILLTFFAGVANAAGTASVYIVHGISGTDLGLPAALPVDVELVGVGCALPNFTFGQIVGPVNIPEGTYTIVIHLASSQAPCTGAAAVTASNVPFAANENATVIAHLDADGNPTASKFENDLSPLRPGKSRLIVQHTAWAPAVDVRVRRGGPNSPGLVVPDFANGDQAAADVRPGTWLVSIAPAGERDAVFGPKPVTLQPYTAYLIYAVGSLKNNTFTLLVKPVTGLHPAKLK
jgi:hypothetical protein